MSTVQDRPGASPYFPIVHSELAPVKPHIICLDTSAVNSIVDKCGVVEVDVLRDVLRQYGATIKLSPVTALEIMFTKDGRTREGLIRTCQSLCDREMLPTSGELLVGFIQNGLPLEERWRSLESQCDIAEIWRDLYDNKDKTFLVDRDEVSKDYRFWVELSRHLRKIAKSEYRSLTSTSSSGMAAVDLDSLIDTWPSITDQPPIGPQTRAELRASLFLVVAILCLGLDTHRPAIEQYWRAIGIEGTANRIEYVSLELSDLLFRGPLALGGAMVRVQCGKPFRRGLWQDCMHSAYLPYVNQFLTGDSDFADLSCELKGHPIASKVKLLDDTSIIYRAIAVARLLRGEPRDDRGSR
jgi:hypothetical protein